MKLALTVLSLLALLIGGASAQTAAQATVAAPATTGQTFPVQVHVGKAPDGTFYSTQAMDNTVIIAVGQFVILNSNPGYLLDPDSIRFSGDNDFINSIPTDKVFEFLAQEIVRQGTLLGYTPYSTDCLVPVRTKVYSASCVTRQWLGALTTIAACSTGENIWEYAVCKAPTNSTLNVTRVPYTNTAICSGQPGQACEPTCPQQASPGLL